jgi:hypothetical protein
VGANDNEIGIMLPGYSLVLSRYESQHPSLQLLMIDVMIYLQYKVGVMPLKSTQPRRRSETQENSTELPTDH